MTKVEYFIAKVLEIIADHRYYYSQARENEFATDCSDLIIRSLKAAGFNTNGATYTGNMKALLGASGDFDIIAFNMGLARRGDIFLKHLSGSQGHTVLYLGGMRIAEASGKKYGLRECQYSPNGYQWIIRPRERGENKSDMKTIKQGSKCIEVGMLQLFLNKFEGNRLAIDCDFGPKTAEAVWNFQGKYGLECDKIVGVNTWSKIYSIMVISS